MSKPKKYFDPLENAPEETVDLFAGKYTSLTEEEKNRMFLESERKASPSDTVGFGSGGKKKSTFSIVEVQPTHLRRPLAAAAACLAAAFAMTVGLRYAAGVYDRTAAPAVPEETHDTPTPAACDSLPSVSSVPRITDRKAALYHKVLNCVDHYDHAAGKIVTNELNSHFCIIEYSVDMENNTAYQYYYSSRDGYKEKTFVKDGSISTVFVDVNTGDIVCDASYRAFSKSDEFGSYENDSDRISTDSSGTRSYLYRQDPTNVRFASKISLFPQETVFALLSDTDNWEIDREEQYLGRDCVIVSGTSPRADSRSFTFTIDKETGIILCSKRYYENGEQSSFMITVEFSTENEEIYIPDDLTSVIFPDPAGDIGSLGISDIAGEYRSDEGYGKITSIVISDDGTFTAYGTEENGISGKLVLSSAENDDGTAALTCCLTFDGSDRPYITFDVDDIFRMSDALSQFSFYKVE